MPRTRDTVRSLTGSLLLILTGALFLIDYSGGLKFGQTWPLLLIVGGVGRVIEHLLRRASFPSKEMTLER